MTEPNGLLEFMLELHDDAGWPLESVLPLITLNPATRLKLKKKGRIGVGLDADLLVFSQSSIALKYVFAMGKLVRTPEWVLGGMFEKGPRIRPILPDEG